MMMDSTREKVGGFFLPVQDNWGKQQREKNEQEVSENHCYAGINLIYPWTEKILTK